MRGIDDLLRSSGLVIGRGGGQGPANVRHMFLHAGQVFTSAVSAEITTILGSCVAVCIWDPQAEIGGMNHYMLPLDLDEQPATSRCAMHAIDLLLEQLEAAGAKRSRLRAKIFGGACILTRGETRGGLGMQNVAAARERLGQESIPIVEEQTGGSLGRKVIYQTANGSTVVIELRRILKDGSSSARDGGE